ncbi:WbqC family protein [Propionivibrio soli]|uniref:WbqC family protein n=1 Tax=Propionivibrio soli TaxID=2976531 RepID=UPI0021E90917
MNCTVVIHQPDFAPYLGFFHRFAHADLFIALDHVQFVTNTSRSWTHRDKIKTDAGERWLTLGIKKPPFGTPINKVELATDSLWVEGNLALLRQNYRKAPAYAEVMPVVEDLYRTIPVRMADFNLRWLEELADLLDVRIPYVLSSTLKPQGQKNELLIDLLQKVGASHYLSGNGARAYTEPKKFAAANIELIWQSFVPPIYPQQFGPFMPNLSVLDALFNCGVAGTRALVRSNP